MTGSRTVPGARRDPGASLQCLQSNINTSQCYLFVMLFESKQRNNHSCANDLVTVGKTHTVRSTIFTSFISNLVMIYERASLHSLVLQNLRPQYQHNWYHPHFLLHEAHLGSEMRSPRGMWRGLMLRHDLLPTRTRHCCTGVPSGGQVSAANPRAVLSLYHAAPAHPGTPVGKHR